MNAEKDNEIIVENQKKPAADHKVLAIIEERSELESPEKAIAVAAEIKKEPERPSHPEKIVVTEPVNLNLNPFTSAPKAEAAAKKKKIEKGLGASYGSAQLTGAIGLLDTKVLCRSFAYAILKHIIFSRGKQTFAELTDSSESRFSYKFGKMLKIDLPDKSVPEKELDVNKCKDILSESIAAMTGTQIKAELLNSYLTVEDNNNEDDFDLSYTQTHIGEILKGSCNICAKNNFDSEKQADFF